MNILVRPSVISGLGIFAQQEIQPNQIVFRLEGPIIQYPTEPDWRAQPNALQVGPNTWKLPRKGNYWKYINHSCRPNSGVCGCSNVVAIRPIHPEEEVTIDYSTTEGGRNWHMRCRCGLTECRGVIRGAQYLSRDLYNQYEPFIPAYLRLVYKKQKTYTIKEGSLRGLFAKQGLHRGEPVFQVKGPIVRHQFSPDYRVGYAWLHIGKNTWINPQRNNPWWFIKHSCQPNVGVVRKNIVLALRDIQPDEELTVDDSMTEADPHWKRNCQCGAKNCRKVIRSVQYLPKKLFEVYQPYMPSFQRHMYLLAHTSQ